MRLALKLICSAAFLVVAFRQINLGELGSLLGSGWSVFSPLPWWLCGAIAIGLIAALVNTFKWWLLLRAAGVVMPWRRVLYHYLVGYFLNTILTGAGEVKRVVDVGRETGEPSAVLTSVFLERWTGVTAQLTLSLAALMVAAQRFAGLGALALLNLAGCLFLLGVYIALVVAPRPDASTDEAPRPMRRLWDTALAAFRQVRAAPGVMAAAVGLSLIVPLLGVATHACLGLALGTGLGFIWVVPIASVFGQMPVSINGLGVQEVAYLRLFELTGMGPEPAMAISMLAHVVKLSVGGLGGLLSLWAGVRHPYMQEPVKVQS